MMSQIFLVVFGGSGWQLVLAAKLLFGSGIGVDQFGRSGGGLFLIVVVLDLFARLLLFNGGTDQ